MKNSAPFFHSRRALLGLAIAAGLMSPAWAQVEKPALKFSMGWLFQATQAQFPLAAEKGYFKAEGLDVTVDRGSGSATSVQRVVSGTYDFSYADVGTIIKWNLENPGRELTMVYVAEDACPLAAIALKKTGITRPKDLEGKRLGAPTFDGGRQMFPVFAKINGLDSSKISWMSMDANLREQMLAKGEVDVITGFVTSAVPSLGAAGVKPADLTVLRYDANGLDCYGNAVVATREFVEKNPRTTAAFVKAVNRGMKELIAAPRSGIDALRVRDPLINVEVETGRMSLYARELLLTQNVKDNGFSSVSPARLQKSIDAVIEAFGIKGSATPASLYTERFLPPKAERIPPAWRE
ncbi:MAG: ABC transporter substrate-binding protein [Burkholderiales bacterium]|jgi:NitT/TauT family transport system substrate-binding protein|nr:ABC transporter substrate-binding protein [Burkholderiales bacterium]